MSIQLRRGTQAQVDASTVHLLAGQPLIATDTGELTIATASQVPSAGKKFVPMELTQSRTYGASVLHKQDTTTSTITVASSESNYNAGNVTSITGYVFPEMSVGTMDHQSWADGHWVVYWPATYQPTSGSNLFPGAGKQIFKLKYHVSGQNYAYTYVYITIDNASTYKANGKDCYIIINKESGSSLNTSTRFNKLIAANTPTTPVRWEESTMISRTPGVVYYDGTKMQAQENLNLTYLKVSGTNALSLYNGGNYIFFNPRSSSNSLQISTSGVTDYTWDFPQQSGPLALLSDIPSVQPEHEVMMSDQVTLNSSNMGQGSITINTATKGLSNAEITGFIVQAEGRIYQFKLEDIYRVETTMGGTIRSLGSIFNSNVGVAVESLAQSYGSNTFNYTATFKFSANSIAYGVTVSAGFTYKGMAFANSGVY